MATVLKMILNSFVFIILTIHNKADPGLNTIPVNTPIQLSCTDNPSTVLNISDIRVVQADLNCANRQRCNLSEDEITHIKGRCDGKESCTVTINSTNRNSCLGEYGYYNFSFSCEIQVDFCNFENGWCGWKNESNSNFKWEIGSIDDLQGVAVAYGNANKTAQVNTKLYFPSPEQCLTFWYYQKGNGINLTIFQKFEKRNRSYLRSIRKVNTMGKMMIDIGGLSSRYKIIFEATQGSNKNDKFALDNVTITNLPCKGDEGQDTSMTRKEYMAYDESCVSDIDASNMSACSVHYLKANNHSINFDPSYEDCTAEYGEVEQYIADICNGTKKDTYCKFNISNFLQYSDCFLLRRILLEYACIDKATTASGSSNNPSTPSSNLSNKPSTTNSSSSNKPFTQGSSSSSNPSTPSSSSSNNQSTPAVAGGPTIAVKLSNKPSSLIGVIVGVIGPVVVVIILVLVLMYKRRRSFHHPNENDKHIIMSSDYTGNQFTNLQHVANFPSGENNSSLGAPNSNYQDIDSYHDISTSEVDGKSQDNSYFVLEPKETGYNRMNNIVDTAVEDSKGKDLVKDHYEIGISFKKSEYPSGKAVLNGAIAENGTEVENTYSKTLPYNAYAVLDPKQTGFYRPRNKDIIDSGYELAIPMTSYAENIDLSDPYVETANGDYDSSNNIRHKDSDNELYSHAVDNVYDTASHAREISDGEDDYDHFVGKKTEDDYDVSTCT